MHTETILHLLSECSHVVDLCTNIKNWIRRKLNIDIKLDVTMKTIGYYNFDEYYWAVNSYFYLVNIISTKTQRKERS